jgi:hypothetical protein
VQLGREPRHQAHRDRAPRIRGALQVVQALPVNRSDCCHCGAITGTAQSRAQSLAGSAPSSIRSKPASSFLGGTQSYQLRPCTCTTEGRVLSSVFSLMRRVDGRGRKDWLAAAFAENAAPTTCRAEAANTHCAMGVSLSGTGTSYPSWPGTTREGGLRLEAQFLQPPESRRASVRLSRPQQF